MPVSGQTEDAARAAEAVVRRAFDAQARMQWDAVAALVHPEALRRFHLFQLEDQRLKAELGGMRPDELYDPEMPAEVRQWLEERRRKRVTQRPPSIAVDFAGVSSVAELEELSPEEAFARWVEAHDPRSALLGRLEAQGGPIPTEHPLAEMHPKNRVLGSVVEDDSTVQVLYRSGFPAEHTGDDALDNLAIATMRRSADGWRIWTTRRDPLLFGMENWSVFFEPAEEQHAEQLQELAGQGFEWPPGQTPRVRAAVQGYRGDARAPETVRIELLRPGGTSAGIELPYDALAPLWEYLQPWLYLPDAEDSVP